MATPLVPDDLWEAIAPLLPAQPPKPQGGRPRVPDRAALGGILFVLRTGAGWESLPRELGCGSGMTCWRRLRDWQAAGVWDRLHRAVLDRLGEADKLDWSRASLDSASVPAKRGARKRAATPPTAASPGPSATWMVDGRGVPLAALLSPANRHDSLFLEPLLDAVPPVRTPSGRRRRRPAKLHADKGYDDRKCRAACRRRRIKHRIARRGIEAGDRLGRHRWVVERTLAWLNRLRRLAVRYERRADIHRAFLLLGCSLVCLRRPEGRF